LIRISRHDAIRMGLLRKVSKKESDAEVLIVGGGPAGLAAAMTLGRLSRTAFICDDGRPRNKPSSHVNNFPTRDGIHPNEWRKLAQKDLEKYRTIQSIAASVLSIRGSDGEFSAVLSTGQKIRTKKVILAYGVQDRVLPVPGFVDLWGKAIFHCPFCHGFENRGKALGFIANGEFAFHALPVIADLASNLIVFTNGKSKFNHEQNELLKNRNIEVVEDRLKEIHRDGERLVSVETESGGVIAREGLFYAPELPFRLKSNIGSTLGCQKTEFGFYKVNEKNETTIPGVLACGDNATIAHSVLLASASGVMAGSSTVFQLLSEKMRHLQLETMK
jgi:thioredoxin reductase